MPSINNIIEQSREHTIQSQVTDPVQVGGSLSVWLFAASGMYVSDWWSPQRDRDLRAFWMSGDHIAGAVYAMESKMKAVPRKVVARDQSIREHVVEAETMTDVLQASAQFGEGWEVFYGKFVEDLLTQDNGAFAEIIGPGNKAGPLTGAPVSIAHLDSALCQRTGNEEFPVVYRDLDGKYYKLHWTRVVFTSQMASPRAEMFGVGFSAVSRAINVAQTLIDVLVFKQEKMGSRPHNGLLITKGGLDPLDVRNAFEEADVEMDTRGLKRYSKMVVAGSSAMPEADLEKFDLSELPEGFDEKTSIELGMASLALAFGVDARELFPAMQSGATRADALLSHLKQRGKGPGEIIQSTEQLFNTKYLPAHLRFVFDYQDDAQDRQVADIRNVRAERRTQDIETTALTVSVARQLMVQDGDLEQGQFELMELQSGKLPDGTPLLTLFQSNDPLVKRFLDIGTEDPLNIEENDIEAVMQSIKEQVLIAQRAMINDNDPHVRRVAQQAVMALAKLEAYYLEPMTLADIFLEPEDEAFEETGVDTRTQTKNPGAPNQEEEGSVEGRHGLRRSPDERLEGAGAEGPK
ncbi:MAG: hypothetical protein ACYTFW_00600 [Planctomycetota bacterium]|jgi:hypothetical protein